jgi:hypothetical protein
MTNIRTTKPVTLDQDQINRFLYGVTTLYRGYRRQNNPFAHNRSYFEDNKRKHEAHFEKLSSEYHGGVMLTKDYTEYFDCKNSMEELGFMAPIKVRRVINDLKLRMPYLEFYPTADSNYKSVTVLHKGCDFPSGELEWNPYETRYKILSPMCNDMRNGGHYTADDDRAAQLCRKYFRIRPPNRMVPFITLHTAVSELDFDKHLRQLQRQQRELQNEAIGTNFGGREIANELFLFLEAYIDIVPPLIRDKILKYRETTVEYTDYYELSKILMHVKMVDEQSVYTMWNRSHTISNLHSSNVRYDELSLTFTEPTSQMSVDFITKIGQLALEDIGVYVPEVGMRMGNGEYIIYGADLPEAQEPMD